jgi:septal ring-binding cell division protein DamX
MNYEFALDKKAVVAMIVGSIVIGVLLFVAGLVVGRQWSNVESSTGSTSAENERANLPAEPVLNEEATPNTDAPKTAKPKLTLPKDQAETATQASVAAAQPPAANGEVRIIEEAATDEGAAGAEEQPAAEPDYVTVQVGVFLDEKDASKLLQQMERKGYAPTFFSGRDAEARQWYAVRIGMYSDKQQAASAAANFTKQEKLKAVVRPVEAL